MLLIDAGYPRKFNKPGIPRIVALPELMSYLLSNFLLNKPVKEFVLPNLTSPNENTIDTNRLYEANFYEANLKYIECLEMLEALCLENSEEIDELPVNLHSFFVSSDPIDFLRQKLKDRDNSTIDRIPLDMLDSGLSKEYEFNHNGEIIHAPSLKLFNKKTISRLMVDFYEKSGETSNAVKAILDIGMVSAANKYKDCKGVFYGDILIHHSVETIQLCYKLFLKPLGIKMELGRLGGDEFICLFYRLDGKKIDTKALSEFLKICLGQVKSYFASDNGKVGSKPITFKDNLPPQFFSLNSIITRALMLESIPDGKFCLLDTEKQIEQLDILEAQQNQLKTIALKNVGLDGEIVSYAQVISLESDALKFEPVSAFDPKDFPGCSVEWYNTTMIKEMNEVHGSVMGDIYIAQSMIKMHKILSSYSVDDLSRIKIYQNGSKFLLVGIDPSDKTKNMLLEISKKLDKIKMNFDISGNLILDDEIYEEQSSISGPLNQIVQIPIQSMYFKHEQIFNSR